MKYKVIWSEWKYCGIENDINERAINNLVNEHIQDTVVYLVSTRKESSEINKEGILERIKKELGQNELFVWDTSFKKAIEFNKIGVMRSGIVPTLNSDH